MRRWRGSKWIGGFGWLGFRLGVRGVLGLSCWRAGGALGANLHVGKFVLSILLFRHLERVWRCVYDSWWSPAILSLLFDTTKLLLLQYFIILPLSQ